MEFSIVHPGNPSLTVGQKLGPSFINSSPNLQIINSSERINSSSQEYIHYFISYTT